MSATDPFAWRPARIKARWPESPRAATLRLEADGWPGHLAGQRVDVRLTAEDGYQATRAYSIASAPSSGTLELTIERIDEGEVSPYLVDVAEPGDELELRGPIGGWFTWRAAAAGTPLVVVAGGSGLVPLMAMAREAAAQTTPTEIRVLVSTRTAEDLLYAEELGELAECRGGRVLHTVTRAASSGWAGRAGRISASLVDELLADLPAPLPAIYVCGSSGFVDAAADLLTAAGVAPASIRTERFGPSA